MTHREPKKGDRMYTPSGRFDYTDESPRAEFDHMDVIGALAGLLIIAILGVTIVTAIPKIAADIHAAEAVRQLNDEGY